MAQKILIKRGLSSALGNLTLSPGELGVTLDNQMLYVGDVNGDPQLVKAASTGTVASADKLTTARTIAINGDVSGSNTFDGSTNVTISATLPNIVTASTKTKITYNAKGQVTAGADLQASDIPALDHTKISDLGTAALVNTGTSEGNVPVLGTGGKLPSTMIPASAISETSVVASQAAMLALSADVGDVAVRTDLNKSFILKTAGASTLANWQELLTPTDAVQSVNGNTGVVVLNASSVGLGNVTNESKTTMFTSAALTGTPTAPTATAATNNTQIATTAFVKAQGYLTSTSDVDGGTF